MRLSILIKERVGYLDDKLDIPPEWRIHLFFSIVQLEPARALSKDLFERPQLTQLPSVYVDGNIDTYKLFEVE